MIVGVNSCNHAAQQNRMINLFFIRTGLGRCNHKNPGCFVGNRGNRIVQLIHNAKSLRVQSRIAQTIEHVRQPWINRDVEIRHRL
jgi:hypothetical protein